MKLRVRNNSVRLRLTQSEVAAFAADGSVAETIEFGLNPDDCLIYALEKSSAQTIGADFRNGKITIFVPRTQAENWTNTNEIGIEAEAEIGNGKTLKILIEKDFACLDRRAGEDDRDAFPHPEPEKVC